MSFHNWLQNLRSTLAPRRGQRRRSTAGGLRAATYRPNFEVLEDRCLLALYAATGLGNFSAADLNEVGQVVGTANTNGVLHAVLWQGGTMIDLGTLGGGQPQPQASTTWARWSVLRTFLGPVLTRFLLTRKEACGFKIATWTGATTS